MLKRTHTCGELSSQDIGKEIVLNGWVDRVRDLGGMLFVLVRDRYGKTQVYFDPAADKQLYESALKLGNEYTVGIKGIVNKRPEKDVNTNMSTGEIEVMAKELVVFSESETPPIYVNKEDDANENLRLKYRYLDLRKEKLQKNLMLRHRVAQATRNYLSSTGFLEIETPFLTKSTPEGARDFLVPSRLRPGLFYALPQSPQIFKQLLMVSGFDRYFQIARCFRDEDFRADRQPEFTQIDIEASFVDKDDIFAVVEGLLKYMFKQAAGVDIQTPFKRLSYADAMDRYGSDKPDTRYGMELKDLTGYFAGTSAAFLKSVCDNGGVIKGFTVENRAEKYSRKKLDEFTEQAKKAGANGLIWIIKDKDGIRSTIKKMAEKELQSIENDGIINSGDVMFVVAGEQRSVNKILGQLRSQIIRDEFEKLDGFDIMWIVDFPMFAFNEEEKKLEAEHHPFTMPNLSDLEMYEKTDPLKIKAECYDLVINGYEMLSGSVRIHRKDIQKKVFEMLGLPEEEINEKFGFLLDAFRYGPPPHAGCALGLDRLVAVMCNEDSIKEVIAFPKTATGTDIMADAPNIVGERQLRDLKISLNP